MASVDMKQAVIDLLGGSYSTNGYYGLSDVYANTDEIADNIFSQRTAAYRAAMLVKWNETNIKVKGIYSRSNYVAPKICVFRSSDTERNDFAGDYLGVNKALSDVDALNEWHTYGSDFDETLEVVIQAAGDGPGQRDEIYLMTRELIIRARPYFTALGVDEVIWRRGSDGDGFKPGNAPHIVHEASASLSYINHMTWSVKVPRITKFQSNLTGYNQGEVTVDPYSDES